MEKNLKFNFTCDDMDGFILIDASYQKIFDSDMLYALDILLDISGSSELIYDFPNENWKTVRLRETASIRNFCSSGKMILWYFGNTVKEGEIEYTDTLRNAYQWLYLPTGNLLAVSASELIQCLSYPELEMEITFTLTVAAGWYAVAREYLPAANSAIEKIYYCKKEPTVSHFHNIS